MGKEFKEEFIFLKRLIQIISNNSKRLEERTDKSLKLLLEKIKGVHGSIMLVEPGEDVFTIVASTNKRLIKKKISIDPNSISGYVYTTGKPLYYKDITKSKKFRHKIRQKNYSTPSLMCIPLKGQNSIIGVVTVSDHYENSYFSKDDFLLLLDYSFIISPLLENSLLFIKLQEEKERYERLAQELKITYIEKSELVEMVVHDFKSPLSAVISNLELLKFVGIDDAHKPIVETAIGGAKKLLDMINEFLESARKENLHPKENDFGPVSLREVLNEVLEELKYLADSKSIKIDVNSQKDVSLWGNRSLFVHLIQNLLSNSIKYTPSNGKIKIYWEIKDAQRKEDRFGKICKVCIEDTGPGIPEEDKRIIFEKFKRLDKNKNVQGSGIGLFICKRIVNLLEGKIWVEDVIPKGSRFCFTAYVWEKNER